MKAPCKNCKDRKLKCHADCERYLKWCKKKEEIKKEMKYEKANYDSSWTGFSKHRSRK